MSEDPIGFNGGDVNVRRYVDNQVTVAVDILGLENNYKQVVKGVQSIVSDPKDDKEIGEAKRIALAIHYTFRFNDNRYIPLTGPKDEKVKGFWCYEWAFAFEDAFKHESSGDYFDAKLGHAYREEDDAVHYWLEITSKETGKKIYIDDGFWEKGVYVHVEPPCGGDYLESPKGAVNRDEVDAMPRIYDHNHEWIGRRKPIGFFPN